MEINVWDGPVEKSVYIALSRLPVETHPPECYDQTTWGMIRKAVKKIELVYRFAENWTGVGRCNTSFGMNIPIESTIQLSYEQLKGFSDEAVIGAIVHELAHAYRNYESPDPTVHHSVYADPEKSAEELNEEIKEQIEEEEAAADQGAIEWGFEKEIKAVWEATGQVLEA